MATQISRWGNSLALRIPATLAEQYGLREGSSVEFVPNERGLLIRKPRYSLEELLQEVTPENLHEETQTGPTRGKEEW